MALITEEEFDLEVSRRVVSEGRAGAFIGLPFGTNTLNNEAPNYVAYGGSLLDIINGENLEASIWRLDQTKNSKMLIYNSTGTMVLANPRAILFNGLSLSVSGSLLTVSVVAGGNVVWGTFTSLTGNFHTQELPTNYFMTGMWVTRGYYSTIGSSIPIITGYGMIGRNAHIG